MNEIILVTKKIIGEGSVNAVNARELHEFLEVGKRFTTWIQGRIEKYEFIENVDFTHLPELGAGIGGQGRIEYFLSMDMAKELSMVENNEKGRMARKYFIECEKKLLTKPLIPKEKENFSLMESELGACIRIAERFGLKGNQALFSGNKMVKGYYNQDLLELSGVTHLIAEKQENHYTPTELGKNFLGGISPQKTNLLLESCLLQEKYTNTKGKSRWRVTKKGEPYVLFKETPKKHSDGTPVLQHFWYESVLKEIKD